MLHVIWTPEAEQQRNKIRERYPFDENALQKQVIQWAKVQPSDAWASGNARTKEFAVGGPAKSLVVTVNLSAQESQPTLVVTSVERRKLSGSRPGGAPRT
jgi:hypothetical protein